MASTASRSSVAPRSESGDRRTVPAVPAPPPVASGDRRTAPAAPAIPLSVSAERRTVLTAPALQIAKNLFSGDGRTAPAAPAQPYFGVEEALRMNRKVVKKRDVEETEEVVVFCNFLKAHGVREERYQTTDGFWNVIVTRLGLPDWELFADEELHRLDQWSGPGGVPEDAWSMDWGFQSLGAVWVNPPFSQMEFVVNKMIADKARGVLLLPHWQQYGWFKKAMAREEGKYCMYEGQMVFEDCTGHRFPLPWKLWAIRFGLEEHDIDQRIYDEDYRPSTVASKRRQRLKNSRENV